MKPLVTILNFILIFIISLFSATNTIPAQMIQKINRNVFIENKGQWPDDVLFMTKMGGMKAWITKTGVVYDFYKTEPHSGDLLARTPFDKKADEQIRVHGNVVKTTLVAPNLMSGRLTMDKQQGYYNYIKGNDASKWAGHVPLYKEIKITEIYDNIDIRYYFHKGHLRYDYIVKPGADPRVIKIKLSGAESYNINGQGELVLKTSLGKVKLGQLLTYQVDKSQEVPSHFVKRNDGSIGISLGAYDKNRPLIIDPLVYSTFIGGSDPAKGQSIVVDKENNVYVTGYTMSSNFPVTTGVYDESANGNDDVFVSKLAADGSNLIYSTYIGGSSSDNAFALVLDSEKNTYILGNTTSNNFPVTTSAYDTSANGYYDIFVSKLSADGSNLIYSTFLGGTDLDIGLALALDNEKNAYVTGYTGSTDFPVTSGAYNNSLNNGQYFYDIFVSKLSSDGSALIYSTFIGGRDNDYGESLALDSENNVYITGVTHSSNFPTTVSAYDENYNGGDDVFVSKLSADGSDLINSTFLGSTNDDVAYSLALDGENNCYITGYTQSADFPTTGGAFDTSFNGSLDAFVGKLSVDGTNLIYSTFLGGIDWDAGNAIVLDSKNNAYVTGYTRSSDFPIASNFYDKTYNGHNDVFLNKLTADGSRLIYSTFLGGNFSDNGNDLAIDNNNNVYITGLTQSGNFPTTSSAFNRTSNGNNEAFVSKISIMKPSKISNTDIIPLEYILKQNYPNPFNPATMIDFTISKNTFVELSIFDVVGKKIQTLVNENLAPGNYKYRFDGSQLASGVYLYMLKTKEFTRVKEMLFIK